MFSFVPVPVSPLFMHTFILLWSILRPETETIFHFCWMVKSSFKLVWMESSSPCNSLISYSLKWHCCSLVCRISLFWKKPIFPLLEEINRLLDCQLWFHNKWSYSILSIAFTTFVPVVTSNLILKNGKNVRNTKLFILTLDWLFAI